MDVIHPTDREGWASRLDKGNEGEEAAQKVFEILGYKVTKKRGESRTDLVLSKGDRVRICEVKRDCRADDTQKLAIEVGRTLDVWPDGPVVIPKGIMDTDADLWAHVTDAYVYVIPTKTLRAIVIGGKWRTVMAGEYNRMMCVLVLSARIRDLPDARVYDRVV